VVVVHEKVMVAWEVLSVEEASVHEEVLAVVVAAEKVVDCDA